MTSRSEVFSHQVPRSDRTISGPEMFCTSLPTRQARARITGTMETFVRSTSPCMLLQALLLYDTMMMPSMSTTKASDNILFRKHPQHNSLKIDLNTDFIRMAYLRGPTKRWKEAQPIIKAVKGSSFAIIIDPTIKQVSHIYYQDPELHLKECYYDHLDTMRKWDLGKQVPKLCLSMNEHLSHFRWLQPRGTTTGDPNNR